MNAGPAQPAHGRELTNSQLKASLESKMEFTRQEWEAFEIKDLRYNDYIKSGASFFQPDACCTFCDKGDFFRCPHKEAPCSQCAPGRDCFSTIVAVTNSAIKKLTSDDITPLAQSRKILCALYNTLCPVHANCGHLYNVTVTWCFDLTSLFQGFFIEV